MNEFITATESGLMLFNSEFWGYWVNNLSIDERIVTILVAILLFVFLPITIPVLYTIALFDYISDVKEENIFGYTKKELFKVELFYFFKYPFTDEAWSDISRKKEVYEHRTFKYWLSEVWWDIVKSFGCLVVVYTFGVLVFPFIYVVSIYVLRYQAKKEIIKALRTK